MYRLLVLVVRLLSIVFPRSFGFGSMVHAYLTSRERYVMFRQAFMYTANESVVGDYLEFGVARARTLIYARRFGEKYLVRGDERGCRYFGFDSFEGFPQPEGIDKVFERFKAKEESHDLEIAAKNLKRNFVNMEGIFLEKGFYDQTLTEKFLNDNNIERARVIHVDCDLYQSAIAALNFITDLIHDGTILLFDDWLCYRARPDRGEQRAVQEWLAANPQIHLTPYRSYANVGQSFIVSIMDGGPVPLATGQ